MKTHRLLSDLFQEEPVRWGLRGDPYLWKELKATVDKYEYPATESQLTTLLEQLYQQLTGVSLTENQSILVERYSHGGMSSGHVSPEFWRERAIPLLLERYRSRKTIP